MGAESLKRKREGILTLKWSIARGGLVVSTPEMKPGIWPLSRPRRVHIVQVIINSWGIKGWENPGDSLIALPEDSMLRTQPQDDHNEYMTKPNMHQLHDLGYFHPDSLYQLNM